MFIYLSETPCINKVQKYVPEYASTIPKRQTIIIIDITVAFNVYMYKIKPIILKIPQVPI